MKVGKISNANTHFSGEVIVLIPKGISPNLETFHRLLSEERIQSLVKDAPFDLFIKENNKGKIDVYLKRTEDK